MTANDTDRTSADRVRDLVKSQFGANASNYTTSGVHAKGKSLQQLIEMVAPKPDWRCLDIATAAGHTAFAFAPHVAHVTASDLTPQMLDEARKLADARDIRNVDFVIADAEALPFADTSFDLVTCRIAPHHFPDISKFLSEVARVLKPGGRFGLVDNLAPDTHTGQQHSDAENAAAAEAYNAFEKARDPSHVRALTHGEWLERTQAAGLTILDTAHVEKTMSFMKWCRTMAVSEDLIPELRQVLQSADGALRTYLRPTEGEADDWSFILTELMLVAERR